MNDATMGSDFHEAEGWSEGEEERTDAEEAGLLADAPTPILWTVLVRPRRARTVTKSGIVIPGLARDAEAHLQYIGQVIAMGPIAGKSEKFYDSYDVAVGDWVCYGRFAGQRITHRGLRLLTLNDDDIKLKVRNPAALRVYV